MLRNNHRRRLFFIPLLLLMMVFMAQMPSRAANHFSNPQVSNGVSTWECVWFGRYYQNPNDNGVTYTPEPLKWRVLNVSGDTALLITDHVIAVEEYNHQVLSSCSWYSSTIRTYINDTMKPVMFTEAEAAALGGDVELPSVSMMNNPQYGFTDSSSTRSASHTRYLDNHLDYTKDAYWLSDTNGYKASVVYNSSVVSNYYNNNNDYGIRPVVRLNLTSNVWYYAGTVSSNGDVNEVEYGKSTSPDASDTTPSSKTDDNSDSSDSSSSENSESAYIVGAFSYTVTNNTATIASPKSKTATKVTIPATVKVNGKIVPVTSIAANAFKGMKNLTTVTIGKNVKKIGKNAFNGCKKLKKITIKTTKLTAKTVGAGAFKGINKKAVFKCPKSKKAVYKKILLKKGAKKTMTFK